MSDRHHVLCVGHMCVDFVCICEQYPTEDAAVGENTRPNRCHSQECRRGGNASNNCTVLSQLGSRVDFLGTIPGEGPWHQFLVDDMEKSGIGISAGAILKSSTTPVSVVILSKETGSRTIVHHNGNMPELSEAMLADVEWNKYDWIHFEGRNVATLKVALEKMRSSGSKLPPISIELEKRRPELLELAQFADVLFVGKELALMLGFNDMAAAARGIRMKHTKGSTIVFVGWGSSGASVSGPGEDVATSPAYPPESVEDTLGAGDTFVSGCIYALAQRAPLAKALEFGCRLAGGKVGCNGLGHLQQVVSDVKKSTEIV